MSKLLLFTTLLRIYTCVCKYFMLIMNTLSEVDQIQRIIDMISGRNKNSGMIARILDLPPELLVKVIGLVDFQCKRNCRLVHNYWRAIIDHNFMKFKIDTHDEKSSVHGIKTLAASQQYFEKVTILFIWEKPRLTLPARIQPYHPFPQIREVVFRGCGPGEDLIKYVMENLEMRKEWANNARDFRELVNFVFQYVCRATEYLWVDLKYLTIIVPEMETTLSNVTWNSLRKLRFCTSVHENSCLFAVMKQVKIPILSEFEIDILPSIGMVSTSSRWKERDELVDFFVDMCHFLLNHKETLRTVKCRIETCSPRHEISGHPDFAEEIGFIHDQLKLEHCQVRMAEQYGRIDFGFVAIALTKGSSSLRSFELAKDYEDDKLQGYSNHKLQKDLKELLRQNGPTLENLSLGFMKIDSNLLKHCTQLKSLEFGLPKEFLEEEHILHLEGVREFTFGFHVIFKELANWVVKHMPKLKVITLKQCEIDATVLEILMELESLQEVKIQRVVVDMDLESYCNDTVGLTYIMHEIAVRDYTKRPFGYLNGLNYSASIFIDQSTYNLLKLQV